ncbi:MAG: deoxynucleoside kinase [Candidatus Peribacteria bacterium]|jgi:thymidylate kinase|nr:deoxynucleoside kinase [Candidatus Peribacteria bacterium]
MKKHIVVEGIHGSGKTSVAKALAEKVVQEGIQAQYYHFPDETDKLGQVIRETVADKALVKNWEITGLLYAAFSNRFHIRTKADGITYIQDRDSVTTGLVFQSAIAWEVRMAIYRQAIEHLQQQGMVLYIQTDKETAHLRMQERNLQLQQQGEVRQHKAKDVFIAEEFENLSFRYEKEMFS